MVTIVYADGGCSPNPGPGGWGVVVRGADGAPDVEMRGGERDTTNNRMELTAAIRALEHLPEGAEIEMRLDSQYVIKSASEWIPGWKRRGWRTATGEVKNVDLMQRLDELASKRRVRWTWLRGHSGEPGNERADRLVAEGRREILARPPGARAPAGPTPSLPPAPAAPRPAAERDRPAGTVPLAIDGGLGLAVARAARAAGITPGEYVERALREALGADAPAAPRP